MRIGFYLMSEKGFEVLKSILANGHKDMIAYVCIGRDKNIQNDFSEEIFSRCEAEGIIKFERGDLNMNKIFCDYKLAVSWRWLIESEPRKLIVLHDSLLPRLRGFSPLVTALINQDKYVGVTAIYAESEFDRGPIISQRSLELSYPVKIGSVIEMISVLYCTIVVDILETLCAKKSLEAKPQNEELATYSLWRDESDYLINWAHHAADILAKINASGYPYLGASTILDQQKIRILDASLTPDVRLENRDCGKVLFVEGENPIIVCGTGLLKIERAVFETGESALPFKNYRTRLKSN